MHGYGPILNKGAAIPVIFIIGCHVNISYRLHQSNYNNIHNCRSNQTPLLYTATTAEY